MPATQFPGISCTDQSSRASFALSVGNVRIPKIISEQIVKRQWGWTPVKYSRKSNYILGPIFYQRRESGQLKHPSIQVGTNSIPTTAEMCRKIPLYWFSLIIMLSFTHIRQGIPAYLQHWTYLPFCLFKIHVKHIHVVATMFLVLYWLTIRQMRILTLGSEASIFSWMEVTRASLVIFYCSKRGLHRQALRKLETWTTKKVNQNLSVMITYSKSDNRAHVPRRAHIQSSGNRLRSNLSYFSVEDIWLTKTKPHNGKPSEQSKTEIVGLSLGQRFDQIRGSLLVLKKFYSQVSTCDQFLTGRSSSHWRYVLVYSRSRNF